MAKINERNKILTVTDCYGWETAQAYLADSIASDSEDEKKLKKARKEAKANKEEKRRAVKSKRRENPSSKRPFHGSNARGSLTASHHSQSPTCWRCRRPGHLSRSCQAAIPAQPLPTRPVFGPSPNIPIQLQADDSLEDNISLDNNVYDFCLNLCYDSVQTNQDVSSLMSSSEKAPRAS